MDDAAQTDPAGSRSLVRGQHRLDKPFDVALGARIRAARVAVDMSQAALGAVAGVSSQQVQKYEAGKDRVSAGTLFRFAAALNVPVSSFFESAPQHAPSKPIRFGAGDALSARIVVLFQQISDPGIRKQLVALAAALADGEGVRLRKGEQKDGEP